MSLKENAVKKLPHGTRATKHTVGASKGRCFYVEVNDAKPRGRDLAAGSRKGRKMRGREKGQRKCGSAHGVSMQAFEEAFNDL